MPAKQAELVIHAVALQLRDSGEFLTSVAQANGRWVQVKVVLCKEGDPHHIGWGLFSTSARHARRRLISSDRRVVEAAALD